MIFYFARVQDTDGKWHRKVGKTSNLDKRFSDKRLYLGWEYIATKQYDKDDIKEVIKLNHESFDRALYSEGALTAASWLMSKKAGLYSMRDLLNFK